MRYGLAKDEEHVQKHKRKSMLNGYEALHSFSSFRKSNVPRTQCLILVPNCLEFIPVCAGASAVSFANHGISQGTSSHFKPFDKYSAAVVSFSSFKNFG